MRGQQQRPNSVAILLGEPPLGRTAASSEAVLHFPSLPYPTAVKPSLACTPTAPTGCSCVCSSIQLRRPACSILSSPGALAWPGLFRGARSSDKSITGANETFSVICTRNHSFLGPDSYSTYCCNNLESSKLLMLGMYQQPALQQPARHHGVKS